MPAPPRVILTQEAEDNLGLAAGLASLGIEALSYPCIATRLLEWNASPLPAGGQLSDFSVVAFTSRRGVQGFSASRELLHTFHPLLACVGPSTAAEAETWLGLRCAILGEPQTAEGLAKAIATAVEPPGKVLHVRGSRAGQAFRQILLGAGFEVSELVVYETITPALATLGEQQGGLAVFASPSAAEAFFAANPALATALECVSIGPVTSARLRELGCVRIHEAVRPSEADLIETIAGVLGASPAQAG